MQSLTRGWNFLLQAWKMAFADKDLLKPSLYAIVVGFIVTLVGIIPIAASVLFFGTDSLTGQVVTGIFGALLIFAQYAVTYVFSAMTVKLIHDYLTDGDGRMDLAWAMVQREWLNILSLAAASTLVKIVESLIRGNGRRRTFLSEALAGILNAVWTEATYLVLPIMVIEDANLKNGLKRATYIVRNNLLLIGLSTVGVRWITGLIGFGFAVIGLVLGFGIAFSIISVAGNSVVLIVGAIILGVLVGSIFFIAANVIGSYTSTAYHTCLYLWARNTEQAGAQAAGTVPAPLAAVLGQ